jgi:DAACS family dicarboxylate/amino acid:cation (Na+ or H+) symporter
VIGVDRLLDMSRTTVNVCGDLTAATWVAKSENMWSPEAVPSPGQGVVEAQP